MFNASHLEASDGLHSTEGFQLQAYGGYEQSLYGMDDNGTAFFLDGEFLF